jgi:zinc D-Ala-D-Ala carboxypeptidase
MSTQISKHFTLEELTKTSIQADNTPNALELQNLKKLAVELLDPIYDKIGPFTITSAFRSKAVNQALAGSNSQVSSTSYHTTGQAADITPVGSKGTSIFMADIIRSGIPYGELYLKTNTIHISLPTATKREVAGVVVDNKYIKFTPEKLQEFLANNKGTLTGVGIVALIGAAYYLTKG